MRRDTRTENAPYSLSVPFWINIFTLKMVISSTERCWETRILHLSAVLQQPCFQTQTQNGTKHSFSTHLSSRASPNKPLRTRSWPRGPSHPRQALVQGGDGLHRTELSLAPVGLTGPVVQQEEALGCRPVLLGHEVVDDGVDGGAQVGENHGGHVEVLAQLGCPVVVHLGEQVPANVVGQPADDEGQHQHHWKHSTSQEKAVSSRIFGDIIVCLHGQMGR